jgi:hypothetical protein
MTVKFVDTLDAASVAGDRAERNRYIFETCRQFGFNMEFAEELAQSAQSMVQAQLAIQMQLLERSETGPRRKAEA